MTALVGGYRFSSSQDLNAAPTYGLRFSYDSIGRSLIDSIGWELTANQFSTTSKSSGEKANGFLVRGDAIYSINPRSKWVPLIALGVGGQFIDRNGVSEKNPFFNYGIGLKYFFEDYLAIRADLRQLMVYSDVKTRNDLEFTTGLTYYFGKERKKKAPPQAPKPLPPPVPIIDETTELPESGPSGPVASPYEMLGATGIAVLGIDMAPPQYQPAPPPLTRKVPARAYKSAEPPQKPATAEEAPAAKAAPVVAPAPPPAPATAAKAAPAPAPVPAPAPAVTPVPAAPPVVQQQPQHKGVKSVRQITIEFHFSSDEVRPAYSKELAQAAQLIKSAQESSAVIEGHTDNIGKLAGNIRLSERRAQNVKNELVKYGVDPRKITIKGHAFSKPKATNLTEAGRQRNRRAVAIITLVN